ncbi:MAG: hypothetical protein KA788_12435, partial [Lacunisphaera sp.]|nr:hypothetical protein [Lacunisphaera sp.]
MLGFQRLQRSLDAEDGEPVGVLVGGGDDGAGSEQGLDSGNVVEPGDEPGPFSESTEEVEGEESAFGLDFLSQFAGVSWDEAETDRGKRN